MGMEMEMGVINKIRVNPKSKGKGKFRARVKVIALRLVLVRAREAGIVDKMNPVILDRRTSLSTPTPTLKRPQTQT
jgi:hypothetical protein